MTLRLGELKNTVTLEEVQEILERAIQDFSGEHSIDLGDFGNHEIECEASADIPRIMKILAAISKEGR